MSIIFAVTAPPSSKLTMMCTAFALNWFLVRYLGDAARYFHPTPSNFEFREKVMQKGFKLLKSLSESGRYDRIVIVGHSLGSVIAYDVLQQLWARDFWKIYKSPRPEQPALKELDRVESGESFASEDTVKPTPEQAMQRFEHYELVTGEDGKPVELGRGAMGVTYKAVDVDLHCFVTLKVISERYLGDESARFRFLREARTAASVRHPNIASVFHLGKIGQT